MLDERLDFMERTAIGAGDIIMGYWDTEVGAKYKDDKSIVTEADLRSNEYIVGELSRKYPGYGLLSEETKDDSSRLTKQDVFIVDPLDGSGDFKRKEEDFCVLIALTENGEPILGVVYEPLKRRMFSAQKGGQAYITEGGRITETGSLYVDKESVLNPVDSQWFGMSLTEAIVGHPKNYKGPKYKRLYELLCIPEHRLKPAGSMGTRMMQVALGETHMILGYTKNLKEWDIAAGHVILDTVGISVTDIEGNPLRYNQEAPKTHNGILVAHPGIKREILQRLKTSLRSLPL